MCLIVKMEAVDKSYWGEVQEDQEDDMGVEDEAGSKEDSDSAEMNSYRDQIERKSKYLEEKSGISSVVDGM